MPELYYSRKIWSYCAFLGLRICLLYKLIWFIMKVADLRCDSRTSFKVKRSSQRSGLSRAGAYRVGRTRRPHCLLTLFPFDSVQSNIHSDLSLLHFTLHIALCITLNNNYNRTNRRGWPTIIVKRWRGVKLAV